MSLYIGIDCGTQSTKAVVLDLDQGRVVARARAGHTLIPGLPAGHVEQHPEQWLSALDSVLRSVLRRVDRSAVRALGVSGQQHGLVPLDAGGKPIRPAKLWCDTSTVRECEHITRRLGGEAAVLREVGNRILPGYTAPKVLWMKRREPKHYRRLRHILLPHDYLNFHLTGELCMEAGDASGTAFLNVRRRAWSKAALEAVGGEVAGFLPQLIAASAACGTLRPSLATRYGLSVSTLVSAGGGDNMMGAVGTGNIADGVVTASLGTSGTVYAYSSKARVDPRGEIAAFCDSTGGWLPLLCTLNGTSVTERLRSILKLSLKDVERAVARTAPGAGGLIHLPYWEGERTPSIPEGTGVLVGLNRVTCEPSRLMMGALEGVVVAMNYGLGRLEKLGIRPREIRITGGGANSGVWRQIAADVFGVPVTGLVEPEGAALGAALQAAWCEARQQDKTLALADLVSRAVAIDPSTTCEPRPQAQALYAELQALHEATSSALRPIFARHRRLLQKLG